MLASEQKMDSMNTFSPEISFADKNYHNYLQGLKLHWKNKIYASVVEKASLLDQSSPEALELEMRKVPEYRLYGWLERHLQQLKYLGRHGMLPVMEAQSKTLTKALDAAANIHPQRLHLDPNLVLPKYYTLSDFHQHPGGIWSDDMDAFAYEWGANAFSFSMTAADRPYRWMAEYLLQRFNPTSIVDLGCGFGKLCIPVKQISESAEVTGVDLSAPLLRLAHLRSIEAGLDIRYIQANAEQTPLPPENFEAVVSYWLLHELPLEAIRNVLKESMRLLKPGGIVANFDMHTTPGGVIGKFLHIGHAARNNEPFLSGLIETNIRTVLSEAGFVDIEIIEAITGESANHDLAPVDKTRTHTFTVVIGRKPA